MSPLHAHNHSLRNVAAAHLGPETSLGYSVDARRYAKLAYGDRKADFGGLWESKIIDILLPNSAVLS